MTTSLHYSVEDMHLVKKRFFILSLDPTSSAESSRSPATGTVKHYGTYYVREGGMSGVPNQLWKQLTSLLGDDGDDDTDTDTIPIDEQRIECETSSSFGTAHSNAAPQFIGTNSFSDNHLSETGPNITRDSDACNKAEVEGVVVEA